MKHCNQADCAYAEGVGCRDGQDDSCPNLVEEEAVITVSDNEPTLPKAPPSIRRFHSGEKLTLPECSRVMHARPTRLIVCAGSQDSGKTTFIARIREMFADGSFVGFQFGGSLTLCAFERASWPATIVSGTGQPVTERSQLREKDEYYHLRVRKQADSPVSQDLLVNDLPGEAIESALQRREFFEGLSAIGRADYLTFFLDCARLSDLGERHAEKDRAMQFLTGLKSVNRNSDALDVAIVLSRWDYVTRNNQRAVHEAFCQQIERDYSERFASQFRSMRFDRVAARPEGGAERTDEAIQGIFTQWCEATKDGPIQRLRQLSPVRDFSAFGLT